MLISANLTRVSSNKTKKPDYGIAIAKRRKELRMSQDFIARETDEFLYKQWLHRLETGKIQPRTIPTDKLERLAEILQWTPKHLGNILGISVPLELTVNENTNSNISEYKIVPILGVAEAGKPNDYPVPKELYRPNMVVYQVSGSSLDSGSPDAIKDGDYLFIDTNDQELRNGKLYVFEIIGDGHCVKRARLVNDEWLLMSDNPEYPTLKITEVKIVGKVYKAFGQRAL